MARHWIIEADFEAKPAYKQNDGNRGNNEMGFSFQFEAKSV